MYSCVNVRTFVSSILMKQKKSNKMFMKETRKIKVVITRLMSKLIACLSNFQKSNDKCKIKKYQ